MITTKDLIEYLQQFDPDTKVFLDKRNWYHNKSRNLPLKVITDSGLFHPTTKLGCYTKNLKKTDWLFINN